jgi:hypothetical protein
MQEEARLALKKWARIGPTCKNDTGNFDLTELQGTKWLKIGGADFGQRSFGLECHAS